MRTFLGTIKERDVGSVFFLDDYGQKRYISGILGRIQEIDVGKRVYLLNHSVIQIENESQMQERMEREENERRSESSNEKKWNEDSDASGLPDRSTD